MKATARTKVKAPKTRQLEKAKSPIPIPEEDVRARDGAGKEQSSQVHKPRSKGTTIALPFADTPVMKRNKEMRAAGGRNSSQNRRSSSGTRGRRASLLIDSGTSNGMRITSPVLSCFLASQILTRLCIFGSYFSWSERFQGLVNAAAQMHIT